MEVRKTILAGLALALLAPCAKADQFNFNLSGCSGGCALPAGTITLTQDGNSVDVQVTLTDPGSGFIDTGNGNSHTSFVFDIAGDPSITLSKLSAGFTYPADSTIDTPFGTFDYGIDCTTCGPGAKNQTPPPLDFTVSNANGSALTISDFSSNSYTVNGVAYNVFFAADIYDGVTGNTGAVGAANPGPTVPEPGSIALLGSGLASMAFFRHRRRAG